MKRRHFIGAAAATGIAVHTRANAQAVMNLRLAHVLSPSEPAHEACVRFAERVTERSQGKIKMEVFPQGQLGGNKEMHELMKQGANVIILTDPSGVGDFIPISACSTGRIS
jgi:TRAP-type transport system periplasmic protein